jgi:hypothetical protein
MQGALRIPLLSAPLAGTADYTANVYREQPTFAQDNLLWYWTLRLALALLACLPGTILYSIWFHPSGLPPLGCSQ